MAHLLGADGISLALPNRVLLDSVTLGLDDGDRVGVVGPNGAGKTTLIRLLASHATPDSGRVTRLGGTTMGILSQSDALDDPGVTVLDVVHGSAEHFEWASDARIRAIHQGLLADLNPEQEARSLSGGQRRRVALAALLVQDPDILFLDEPTNHLDVEGVDWLARHLNARYGRAGQQGALVVVTHDRWFLDAVCSRMWEVVGDGRVDAYEGGYAAYVLARAERDRRASVAATKRNNLLRKELAWLRRGAPARTSKPRFRLDAASALIEDVPPPRDSVELTRLATKRLGKDVLDLENVTAAYPGTTLLKDVTWRLGPGDRYGIVGVNGAGKTTLLALLAGRRAPESGRIKRGKTVAVAELRQDVGELSEVGHLTPVQVVERERGVVRVGTDGPKWASRTSTGQKAGVELTAGQLTERLGFNRERAHTPVKDLSGGERRRLALLRILIAEPNVLLLDEPTNDLDTDTLAAVEDLLDSWSGCLVVVSHDRYLLERVCDRQWAMYGDGTLVDLPGGVEEYLDVRRRLAGSSGSASDARGQVSGAGLRPGVAGLTGGRTQGTATSAAQYTAPNGAQNAAKPETPTAPAPSAATRRQARKDLQRIERQLARLDDEESTLHTAIAANPTDVTAVTEADKRLRALAEEREAREMEWLEAAELAGDG
ncbi:MAG: ATP-binding cassette domain-containing protein [Cellulomonadaceae bacterium]|jgi:ATPase subunit of ABC transporter with duplicated ATPase domains|nr:ATP-binding cassette domain-containing protein [Cellulomonadaceae bacterium]